MSELNSNNNQLSQDNYKVEDAEEKYLETFISKVVKILRDDGHYVPDSHLSFVAQIIRVENYSVERSVKLAVKSREASLILYDKVRDYVPSKYYHLFGNQGIFKVLKRRDDFGRCVSVIHWGKWNPEELSYSDAIAALILFFQWVQKSSTFTQRNGNVLVNDMSGFGLKQLRGTDIGLLMKVIPLGQTHTAAKVEGVHYVFAPRLCDYIYYVGRPFVMEQLRDRLHFHSKLDTFHEHVKPEILPKCLGGLLDEVEAVDNKLHKTFAEGGAEFVKQFIMDVVPKPPV